MNLQCSLSLVLVACFYAHGISASTIICDQCSAENMLQATKNAALTKQADTHQIGVLNLTKPAQHFYQVTVTADHRHGLTLTNITTQRAAQAIAIENEAILLRQSIDAFKAVAFENFMLPDSPYTTATAALSEPVAFATYLTYHLRQRTGAMQQQLGETVAVMEKLAKNADITEADISDFVVNELKADPTITVFFADQTTVQATITFIDHLQYGLVMNVTSIAADKKRTAAQSMAAGRAVDSHS